MKRFLGIVTAVLLLSALFACGERSPGETELDLGKIAGELAASGYFPDSLEEMDPGEVPGQLSLYEDRIEAKPEDIVEARYSMALGVSADQFILIEGVDAQAVGRLEKALSTYAEDQRSAYEFYNPEQAARLDNPILMRQGNYVLFAVGEDQQALADLCDRLLKG